MERIQPFRSAGDQARNDPDAFEQGMASLEDFGTPSSKPVVIVPVPLPQLEAWQRAWRDGFSPQFSTAGLTALRDSLFNDDVRLLQGATCSPLPLNSHAGQKVVAACVVCLIGWIADGIETVDEIEEYFAHVCFEADRRLGERTACRRFLNWFDDSPRDVVRHQLLAECEVELLSRSTALPRLHVPEPDPRRPAA